MDEQNITLHVSDDFTDLLVDQDGNRAACTYGESKIERAALARRIVACVNACAGVPSHELEQANYVHAYRKVLKDALTQRDELLAALEQIANESTRNLGSARIIARAAIARVKGGAA